MIKLVCDRCGACFTESEADKRTDLVDIYPDGRGYFKSSPICPECGADDLTEIELKAAECIEFDDLIGCGGDCDDCPLMTNEEAKE